jgi:hypothetical protein
LFAFIRFTNLRNIIRMTLFHTCLSSISVVSKKVSYVVMCLHIMENKVVRISLKLRHF